MASGRHDALRSAFLCLALMLSLGACSSGSSSGSSDSGGASSTNPPPATTPPPAPSNPELDQVTPQSFSLEAASGAVVEREFSFRNDGDAALSFTLAVPQWVVLQSASSGDVAPGATQTIRFEVVCTDANLSGVIDLTTNDTDVTLSIDVTCLVPATGVEIAKVTLNQGARAFDSSIDGSELPMSILAGRTLLVRAFATGNGVPPDGRLILSNPGQSDRSFSLQTPPSIDATPAADGVLSASHYTTLPASEVTPQTSLRIEVGDARFPTGDSLDLRVVDPGTLEITLVPVTYEGQTPALDADTYLTNARKVLPVGELDVQIRSPYVFSGEYDLETLLEEMADLRGLDGSSRLYHGVIIPPGGSSSGTAGIAYVGYPVGVSIDLAGAGFVIAHEIGHNLSLGHAPGCGAPGVDADYPNAEGTVPDWGYDIVTNTLLAPSPTRFDFMSYCNSLWVSRYHFNAAIEHRGGVGIGLGPAVGQDTSGLQFVGRMDEQGGVQHVRMLPVPRVVAAHRPAGMTHSHTLVAWDQHGLEVLRHRFTPRSIEDSGGGVGFVFNLPAPVSSIDHYGIFADGERIHSQRLPLTQHDGVAVRVLEQDTGSALAWTPQPHRTLVVRDLQGQVVSASRGGELTLPASIQNYRISVLTGQTQGTEVSLGPDTRVFELR